MQREMEEIDPLLRKAIKVLLLQLAARCENPSRDLEVILSDVISELYVEAQQALQAKRSHLRLMPGVAPGLMPAAAPDIG